MKNLKLFNEKFKIVSKYNRDVVHQIKKRNSFNRFNIIASFPNIAPAIFFINQLYFHSNNKGRVGKSAIKKLLWYADNLNIDNGNLVIKHIVKISDNGYTQIRKLLDRERDIKGVEDEKVCKELAGKELIVIKSITANNNLFYICNYDDRTLLVPKAIIDYDEKFYVKKDNKLIPINKIDIKYINYLPINNFNYINNMEKK